jgi:hypothetical protein
MLTYDARRPCLRNKKLLGPARCCLLSFCRRISKTKLWTFHLPPIFLDSDHQLGAFHVVNYSFTVIEMAMFRILLDHALISYGVSVSSHSIM